MHLDERHRGLLPSSDHYLNYQLLMQTYRITSDWPTFKTIVTLGDILTENKFFIMRYVYNTNQPVA